MSGPRHIVEANYDIENLGERTLCTNMIQKGVDFEVLSNAHLSETCHICKAILDQRISNMPGHRKGRLPDQEPRQYELPICQLGLDI
ncbi:hypothetical protein M3P05_02525 [Sansalvadorimonas sp. 2012CJ34-2]|uniref:Uncharacterized protein n=1 Tax=Parendozoicomonas callyspongiae TaxID=2942213 RepID=A0ABT0PBX8_9GAMM|nr:hypothetical protein [Sansalvadorimonas sp. 2012CJ34-2]MCL6268825.1 hypothetical protein [Sansalvadorimonas sp. 2012CJ34-2]